MCEGMYSPRISEDLIPVIYRLALKKGVAMTKIVDDIIRTDLHIRGKINDETHQRNNHRRTVKRAVEG